MNIKKHIIIAGAILTVMACSFSFVKQETKTIVAEASASDVVDPIQGLDDYMYLFIGNFESGRYVACFHDENKDNVTWVDGVSAVPRVYKFLRPTDPVYTKVEYYAMIGTSTENTTENIKMATYTIDNIPCVYRPNKKQYYTIGGIKKATGNKMYVLTVGSQTTYMLPFEETGVQITISNVNANDSITLTDAEFASNPTLTLRSTTDYTNNLTEDSKMKVGGDNITITVSTSTNYPTYITGYGTGNALLDNLCNIALNKNCNANVVGNMRNYWGYLTDEQKARFNAATVTLGNNVPYSTYGNIINEAATRYAVLINKGYEPIEGITLTNTNFVQKAITTNTHHIYLIITLSTITVASVVLVAITFKRKKHN